LFPPASLYWEADVLVAEPLVPAVELDGLAVELGELEALPAGLGEAPGVRPPADAFTFARMKLSALDAPAALAVPVVPVADGPVEDCRQPVTVMDWLALLVGDAGVCGELVADCAATPTLIAAARTDPNTTLRFICVVPPVGCLQKYSMIHSHLRFT
jgi:hypothetical protein